MRSVLDAELRLVLEEQVRERHADGRAQKHVELLTALIHLLAGVDRQVVERGVVLDDARDERVGLGVQDVEHEVVPQVLGVWDRARPVVEHDVGAFVEVREIFGGGLLVPEFGGGEGGGFVAEAVDGC